MLSSQSRRVPWRRKCVHLSLYTENSLYGIYKSLLRHALRHASGGIPFVPYETWWFLRPYIAPNAFGTLRCAWIASVCRTLFLSYCLASLHGRVKKAKDEIGTNRKCRLAYYCGRNRCMSRVHGSIGSCCWFECLACRKKTFFPTYRTLTVRNTAQAGLVEYYVAEEGVPSFRVVDLFSLLKTVSATRS